MKHVKQMQIDARKSQQPLSRCTFASPCRESLVHALCDGLIDWNISRSNWHSHRRVVRLTWHISSTLSSGILTRGGFCTSWCVCGVVFECTHNPILIAVCVWRLHGPEICLWLAIGIHSTQSEAGYHSHRPHTLKWNDFLQHSATV